MTVTGRLTLQLVAVVGAFVLAALGQLDADAAVGFAAGALAVPSAGDALAAHRRQPPTTRGHYP